MGFWNEVGKLYCLAQVNLGRALSWKERRLSNKIRLTAMFPYAMIVGIANKVRGILETRHMRRERHEKYHLAIVAIAKNEGRYIAEWCAWHQLIGVDCIIVYDNDSTDDTLQVLQPFIDIGFVIYNTINGRARQMDAYNDAIKRYGQLCRYMAIIDCDEFLHPLNEGETLKNIVDSTFEHSKNIGGIAVNWTVFGTSGHTTKIPGLVMERFTHRSKPDFVPNIHVKSIVCPECIKSYPNPHYAIYRKGFYCVNMKGHFVSGPFSPIADGWYRLRLEHYYTKSNEEYLKRREQGCADSLLTKRTIEDMYSYDRNEVSDTTMACHSSKIRKMLEAIYSKEYVTNL